MKLIFKILSISFIFELVQACSVCMGADDEPAIKAVKSGMEFMIVLVGFVLSCFAFFIYNLHRKSKGFN